MISIDKIQNKVIETYLDHPTYGVQGWLSNDEQSALYALTLCTEGPILEIGSWVGLSTACIAYGVRDSGKKRVFVASELNPSMENFRRVGNGERVGFFLPGDEIPRGTSSIQDFRRLVQPVLSRPSRAIGMLRKNLMCLGLIDLVTILEGDFSSVPNFGYQFIFCDTTHTPYEILLTIRGLKPYLSPGVILALHDINIVNEKVVKQYIAFESSFKIDSLLVGQVSNSERNFENNYYSDIERSDYLYEPVEEDLNELTSIILPTYNRANILPRAIHSVLTQTYKNFELIIVDDASTDETPQIIQAFDDPRVRYIRHPHNKGAAAARNTGIKACRGVYIAFQDSDDEWLPHKLAWQMDVLTRSPLDVGVVYSSFWQVRGSSKHVYPSRSRKLASFIPSKVRRLEGHIYDALLRGNFVTMQALVRKVCFEKVGMFDERLPRFQDWELWLRVSKHYRFKFISAPLLFVYFMSDSISTDSGKLFEAFELILDKHYDESEGQDDLLAQYLHMKGDLLYRGGILKAGQANLFKAARLSSFNTFYWLRAFASLFGQKVYRVTRKYLTGA